MDNIDVKYSDDFILILDSIIKRQSNLIDHHVKSINNFYEFGIEQIISKGFNIETEIFNDPSKPFKDETILKYVINTQMFNIKLTSPKTVNYKSIHKELLYPNEAHINDLTYSADMFSDVDIIVKIYKENNVVEEKKVSLVQAKISKIPVMVHSNLCNLHNKSKETLIALNEDPHDFGGFFVVKGNEWCIDSFEVSTFNNTREFLNMGYKNEVARADVISKPGDFFENSSQLISKLLKNNLIVFEITNRRLEKVQIPFYVLFRAFGVIDPKEIISCITYSFDDTDPKIRAMVEILNDAITGEYTFMKNAKDIYNQNEILEIISEYIYKNYIKGKTNINTVKYNVASVLSILDKDVLPHVGLTKDDRYKKVRFMGHIIHRLLLVHLGYLDQTDRDSYKYKRVVTAGSSFAKFFKAQFNSFIVQKIQARFQKDFRTNAYEDIDLTRSFIDAVSNYDFEKALIQSIITGDKTITVRKITKTNTVSSQQIHRNNTLKVISIMRQINTNNSSSAKQSNRANEMRRVHPSMIGFICCVQSADTGEKVGVQKQLAISASVCLSSSSDVLKNIVIDDEEFYKLDMKLTNEMIYKQKLCKVFVNGDWIGCCDSMYEFAEKYRNLRRQKKIHHETTVSTDPLTNELKLWCDYGRLKRPLIIVYNNIGTEGYTHQTYKQYIKLTVQHLESLKTGKIDIETLVDEQVIEYITPEEHENLLIAHDYEQFIKDERNPLKRYTHVDIPQAIMGLLALTSPCANHNQAARLIFQTNQVKQACSIPIMNFPYKTYKEMHIQYYIEFPLVKTISNKYTTPIGCNAIVAVMNYGGFNQDDSIIVNKSSIERGLYMTSHSTFVKTDLEKNEILRKADRNDTVNIKAYFNYEKLVNGVVAIGTVIEKDDIIIGKLVELNKNDVVKSADNSYLKYSDQSVVYKHHEPAIVYNVIISKNEDGKQFCKVVYRHVRKVDIGNKFSSRSGQKSTVGILLSETDMPFTKDGIHPDIIFNPQSLPTRMTMSVIIEGMLGKICANKGTIKDATTFKKIDKYDIGKQLEELGFNKNGTEKLYNGISGKHINADIYIAPWYYQCLQKFTDDTVYSNKASPTDAITGQPLEGRSRNGSIRCGEMEQQVLASTSPQVLQEKTCNHSDIFYIYICEICNKKAIVNEEKNIYKCNTCGNMAVISKVQTTYSVKQYYDELESANIGIKFHLDENTYQQYQCKNN